MTQNDLIMRPITGRDELDLFRRLPYVLDEELGGDLDAGRRRPEWMWMALRGDRLAARLAWWAPRENEPPYLLDTLDLDDALPQPERVDIGVRLLETAMAAVLPAGTLPPGIRPSGTLPSGTLPPGIRPSGTLPPEYTRFVPARWRDDVASRRIVGDRMAVLERLGARLLVERLRLEWRPGTPIAPPSGRLRFRPVHDREELVELMTLVLDGTLDVHSRAALARMPAAQVAAGQYDDELARYPSPQAWWRVAALPGGEPVGFVIPARNDYNAIIAYIGVLPAHRGNGHIGELLAEGTRILAAQDVPRVRASTDVGNVPMARAFERAGYVAFQREITMTWG